MLRNYVGPSIHRHPLGRSARRQERSFAPGPSPALARRKTPHFAGPRPQSVRPYQGRRERGSSSLAPPFSSCRRVQHSCGSARSQRSCVAARPPHHLRPRSSKVRLRRGSTWSLFLQASAGKNPARSLPGAQEAAVPAAGAENAGHRPQDAAVKTASLACTHPTLPVIHCAGGPASAMLPLCFYSKVSACSRRSLYPASTSSRAHSFGPSRPRRRRPSAFRTSCRSLSASGSLRSPSRCPAKARHHPTPSRPPPAPRSTSFRALWHWQTHRRPTRPPPQPKPL